MKNKIYASDIFCIGILSVVLFTIIKLPVLASLGAVAAVWAFCNMVKR